MSDRPLTILHLAPHPDDEMIAAPATMMALRDAGHRIISMYCSFGATDSVRRKAEAKLACERARFEFQELDPPAAISGRDDLAAAQRRLSDEIRIAVGREQPAIVASPTPHDRHHGHEVVARAARDALEAVARAGGHPPRWWMWSLWGELPLPTLGTAFDEGRMDEVLAALAAYRGELDRNDYTRMVRGRAMMNSSIGPEKLYGFGSPGVPDAYVELLTEAATDGNSWLLGSPHWLDPAAPLAGEPGECDIRGWLHAESVTTRYGSPRRKG